MAEKKKRRPQVRLHSSDEEDCYGGGFEDCIYLRQMGDGSLKMLAIKFFEGRKELLDSVAAIRTPKKFDKAFSRISMVVENDGYTDELFKKVAKLDPAFAIELKAFVDSENDGDAEEGQTEGPKPNN